jgi:hypothetical protein
MLYSEVEGDLSNGTAEILSQPERAAVTTPVTVTSQSDNWLNVLQKRNIPSRQG